MAEDKKTNQHQNDRIPVSLLRFVEAQDLPGEQLMGVSCVAEPTKERRSYVANFVPSLQSFELTTAVNGTTTGVHMIPLSQVKIWKRLGER